MASEKLENDMKTKHVICFFIGLAGWVASPLLIFVSWHFLFGVWFMLGGIWFCGWQLPIVMEKSQEEPR